MPQESCESAVVPALLKFSIAGTGSFFSLLLAGLHFSNFHIVRAAFCACLLFLGAAAGAQYRIKGTVYDSSRTYPLEAVSVLSSSGRGTATDASGNYSIDVSERDSIWFSYLNKPTIRFAVTTISDPSRFDISLMVNVQVLKEVKVLPRNYRFDSIQNRRDYARAFNFQRPNLNTLSNIGPYGAGIDINELIRVFQFRRNKSMQKFRERLIQQERDKFIDHRFSKSLVRRLTNLDSSSLDSFMMRHRPPYEFTLYSSDFEFQTFIKESHKRFMKEFRRGSSGF